MIDIECLLGLTATQQQRHNALVTTLPMQVAVQMREHILTLEAGSESWTLNVVIVKCFRCPDQEYL